MPGVPVAECHARSRLDTLITPGAVTQSFGYDSDERLSTWTDVFGSGGNDMVKDQ